MHEALELLKKYDTVIIHRHTNPDGDAMGSQIGLKNLLLDNFPEKKVYVVGDGAGRFSFMDGSVMDEISDETYRGALAVILDSAEHSLVSDDRYTLAEKTLRIDHHIFCEKFADVEIVETAFESCAGLVTHLAREWGLTINTSAAKALFTGIVTDSGRFRYDSTTPRTFSDAAFLLEKGFNPTEIYDKLYVDDFSMIKMRAGFVLDIRFTKNNVAYIYSDRKKVDSLGVSDFTVSRGMVNVMAEIRGVDVWVNFTESTDGTVLAELRSRNLDINKIAVKYGGGGHLKASGASLKDKAQAMEMLADLDKLVGENK
ncbi:MAG: bifunctional oligoribonuclease/PAP phosphatase NrnA [Faecalibacterium sp.]|jgi:phosphoesterase RecJ-like protein|nr:bifunctional oligoribonuclease/PAP phosphatase NrnA [Faecalibacterium sp.]